MWNAHLENPNLRPILKINYLTHRVLFDFPGLNLAERVGFEPTVTHKATTVFETVPFNRSGTSPGACQVKISLVLILQAWLLT